MSNAKHAAAYRARQAAKRAIEQEQFTRRGDNLQAILDLVKDRTGPVSQQIAQLAKEGLE